MRKIVMGIALGLVVALVARMTVRQCRDMCAACGCKPGCCSCRRDAATVDNQAA
jgi:hypothetical protein